MLVYARFALPDGTEVHAGPAALVGRAWSAEVRIDDGRVSEAHALVSLRGSALSLLALRGRIRVGGRDRPRVELEVGQTIELAKGVELRVLDVRLPDELLGLDAPGMSRQVLTGVTSIIGGVTPRLVSGHDPEAGALAWSDGLAWRLRIGDGAVEPLDAGRSFTVQGTRFTAITSALREHAVGETGPAADVTRLRIVSHYDTVQIWRDETAEPQVLTGQPARVVSELLAVRGPIRWEAVAEAVWGKNDNASTLRHRLDVTLAKARRVLRDAGVRSDLLTAHHNGCLELLLYPGDLVDDRS
ncbi:hypothetical protein L6R52_18445 [Myxococcota bacterium]|nr:hypothetical protein [Myxococcota bacterium]